MKKSILFVLSVLCSVAAFAQSTIKGNVIDSKTRQAIVGVSVVVEGTTKYDITDGDGAFELEGVKLGANLQISFIGYENHSVPATALPMTVELVESAIELDEVVVTALNVTKEKKVLGYAIQDVKGEALTTSRDANPMSSLVGKVAGLTVSIPTDLLSSPTITLRGVTPIFVVDGVPVSSDTWNVSPDDIESITVLKGPTAAALYGSAGKNGAVQITTKRGTGKKGRNFIATFNSSTTFQTSLLVYPETQSSYGAGNNFQYSYGDGLYGTINGINNQDANVWGPRFEGQLIKQYDSPMDADGVRTATPWVSRGADNLKNFLQTGVTTTNNVSIAQQTEQGDFRLSLSDTYQKGLVPNTKLNSFNINFSGTMNLSKRSTLMSTINFNRTTSPNYPELTYEPRSVIYNLSVWRGAEFDVMDLQDYWIDGMEGLQQYNTDYAQYNNPWFMAYENLRTYDKDDVHGQVSYNYRFTPDLDVIARVNLSTNSLNETESYPVSASFYGDNKWVGAYDESYDIYSDLNADILLNYAKQLNSNFGIKASAGGSYRMEEGSYAYATTYGGLIVPGIYTLQNSVESTTGSSSNWLKETGSLYGYVDFDYKDFLFLSITGRMDTSSTLPLENNTYFYPSVSLSAVMSDVIKLPEVISFWRVRGSFARVGGDLEVYQLLSTYSQGSIWNGQTPMYVSGSLLNPSIEPEFSSSFEIGTDLRFFNNRLNVDFSYFYAEDGPQIFSLSTASSSGYTSRQLNGLTYTRKGWEVVVSGTPIRTKELSLDLNLNISSSHSYLKEVYGDLDYYGYVQVGERIDQLWIDDFMRSADGEVIYENGLPVVDTIEKYWGNYDPDFSYGFGASLNYKQFALGFSIDGMVGGYFLNSTWENLWRSGTHIDSDNEWRLADWEAYKSDPDGYGTTYTGTFVGDGVVVTSGELVRDQDGNVISDTRTYEKNTTPVLYQSYAGGVGQRTESTYVQSRTYAKLRDVTLTYNIPSTLINRIGGISAASVSFVGRNLLYITKDAKFVDLDQFTSYTTTLQTPSTRNFGFNINLTF
ncbi:MAG: SusC/RagA family TonB-linked outer membrane protein [Rikenellaceae bacterium]